LFSKWLRSHAYRGRRRNDGHFYYDATSDTDLELKIERLCDDLAKLRQAFNPSIYVELRKYRKMQSRGLY
jgi:hypothetical protein